MNKHALFLFLFLMACGDPQVKDIQVEEELADVKNTTLIVVRHAEKEKGDDPGLTPDGKERAMELATIAEAQGVDVVFTSQYKRTVDTGKASSTKLGIPITQFEINRNNFTDYPSILASIIKDDYVGSDALVVTHSNIFMPIVNQFVDSEMAEVSESEYDRIATIYMTESDTTVIIGKFGQGAEKEDK